MIKMKKLNSCFQNPLSNGIITSLSRFNFPFLTDNLNINIEYHGNHSGNKIVSPLIDNLLGDNEKLTDENINTLADIISSMYSIKWTKLYNTTIQEYNMLHNYDMTETESINREHNNTSNSENTTTVNSNSSDKNTGTVNTTNTQNSQTDNSVFGFNSSTAVPSEINNNEITLNQTVTNDLTDTTTSSDTTNSNTNMTDDDTTNESRNLSRSGNIGVTTSQQMIQSERDLWNWLLFDTIFNDIDKILTIQIY